ncbi:CU044_5270 family protein [Saccharothrix australiensis]|uniref:CU044_5270 family protein n=1 Tax=Saccharothrix australiensis TaxID=2072 RepID=A0A495VVX3_9PSEU|nr:CU044_5270 family protein [Saccharothrix australiensis]RKT51798.1 hypothetical protein C8E97_0283 [Saccharothrix australiensis]
MSDDNVRRIWTDAELDAALAAFNADVRTDERVIARARATLAATAATTTTATTTTATATTATATAATATTRQETDVTTTHESRPRRSKRRWLAGAAAVAVLVAGGLVVQTVSFGRRAPATAEAVATLDRAAARTIGAVDHEVGPGQYRYVATRAWWMASTGGDQGEFARLVENVLETWVPADPRAEWLLRRDVTGNQRWVVGTEEQAKAAGVDTRGGWPEGEWRAPCGEFFAPSPERRCAEAGSWQHPTAEWQAGLPTDPDALFERLAADAPDDRGDAELLVYAADALRSGLIGKDVRATLYQALAKLPGLEVSEQRANLDGRTGTALGIDDGSRRQEIIIDPETGRFIGERQVATDDSGGFKAGTVLTFTSVTTGVADAIGQQPTA